MIHLHINKSAVSVLFTILFASLQTQAVAQVSKITRYDNITGTNSHITADEKNYYIVSCRQTSDDRSCFLIVDRQTNTKKQFYTSQPGTPAPGVSYCGYIVNDITVDGNDCWFCGTKWVRTGNFIYDTNGLLFPETNFYGYVGRFGICEALLGGGKFRINVMDNFIGPQKIVVNDRKATIIGGRRIAEFTSVNDTIFNRTIGLLTHDQEIFVDIVSTGDTVVTLSRYTNIIHYFFYHDVFGLRYGAHGNLINTSDTVFNYDVYYAFGDRRARFDSIRPIFLCPTGSGCGVTISYIPTIRDISTSIAGRLLMFHVKGKNKPFSTILLSSDTSRYAEIKRVKTCPYTSTQAFTTVLLHDSIGRSILRYPILNHAPSSSVADTIKRLTYPYLDDVRNFTDCMNSNLCTSICTGHFPNFSNKSTLVFDSRIHYTSSTQPKSCFFSLLGQFSYLRPEMTNKPSRNYPISSTSSTVELTGYPYTTTDASENTTCSGS